MEIMEIIKESFVFPSTDLGKLAIYIALSFVGVILALLGGVFTVLGFSTSFWLILGVIFFVFAFILSFILGGYMVSIIKSGIDKTDAAPTFEWKGNFVTGIKYVVVTFIYYLIPVIIVFITGLATNLFGNSMDIFNQILYANMYAPANTTVVVSEIIPQSQFVALGTSMIITGIIALVLFIIFTFLQTMAAARLANTDSLGSALNIVEAFKDIGRIGWGKVIATVLLIFILIFVINAILSTLNYYVPGISILSIVVTPYLMFFASRATGLLYSDIA